ncbi:unnamed protein product [Heterobilharzia americana]|nr:unnamed protein product [Heterobilharzia americana]
MNMSVTETVKSISSIIKRNVDPTMLFDKGEYMDEVLWQVFCVLYNTPGTSFKKLHYIKLLMITASHLGFTGSFTLSNLRDKRGQKKWLPFLSALVSWFEFTDMEALRIIDIAREKKRKHTEVFNLLESREGDLWNCREAEQERRKVISDLEMKVWKLKSCFTEKNANMSSKENLLQFLVSSVEQKKEQKESLQNRLQALSKDYENLQSLQLDNCEMLPESIKEVKSQLDAVESDMYMIYEAFNGIVDRITTFQNYEYLLNSELRPAIDQVYNLMDKLVAFSKEEKEHQAVVDVLTANLKNMEASLDENKQQLVEYGSQLMRKKVLLNTKKKRILNLRQVIK